MNVHRVFLIALGIAIALTAALLAWQGSLLGIQRAGWGMLTGLLVMLTIDMLASYGIATSEMIREDFGWRRARSEVNEVRLDRETLAVEMATVEAAILGTPARFHGWSDPPLDDDYIYSLDSVRHKLWVTLEERVKLSGVALPASNSLDDLVDHMLAAKLLPWVMRDPLYNIISVCSRAQVARIEHEDERAVRGAAYHMVRLIRKMPLPADDAAANRSNSTA